MTYKNWVVLDTETTGLDPLVDKIVEIAVVWREGKGEGLKTYSSLINPKREIPPEVSAVHHLTNNHVKDSPTIDELFKTWTIPPGIIVCHNSAFDSKFLPQFKDRLWLCTYRCALHIWPEAPTHTNMCLRYWLNLDVDVPSDLAPHRALYDTIVTTALLERMLQGHTLQELYHLQNKPVLLLKARFGKHRGELFRNIPRDYLQWVLRQSGDNIFDDDVRHTAKYWIDQ